MFYSLCMMVCLMIIDIMKVICCVVGDLVVLGLLVISFDLVCDSIDVLC